MPTEQPGPVPKPVGGCVYVMSVQLETFRFAARYSGPASTGRMRSAFAATRIGLVEGATELDSDSSVHLLDI